MDELSRQSYERDTATSTAKEGLFDSNIVLEAVINHAEAYPLDTEFCGYLREMYELDKNLFLQTISRLPKESIQTIAMQLSHAEKNNLGNVAAVKTLAFGKPFSEEKLGAESSDAKDILTEAFANAPSVPLDVETDSIGNAYNAEGRANLNAGTIGPISYTNVVARPADFEINRAMTWKTNLSGLTANTTYRVELLAKHDGSSTLNLKGSVNVTTNSSGAASASGQVTFSSPGSIWTTIRVYRGSLLTAERTGGATDKIYARWSISLALNASHRGTLYFYYASGAQGYVCSALGKADNDIPFTQVNGHTPPGDYYGEAAGPAGDTAAYGPNKFVRMKGNQDPGFSNLYVTGDYVQRLRSGLLIHGGRSQSALQPTNGCVRFFDKDALSITNLMIAWKNSGYHQFGRIKITRL